MEYNYYSIATIVKAYSDNTCTHRIFDVKDQLPPQLIDCIYHYFEASPDEHHAGFQASGEYELLVFDFASRLDEDVINKRIATINRVFYNVYFVDAMELEADFFNELPE